MSTPILLFSSIYKRSRFGRKPEEMAYFPSTALCYVVSGEGTLRIDTESYSIQAHQLYYIPEHCAVSFMPQSVDFTYYILFMRLAFSGGKPAESVSLPFKSGLLPFGEPQQAQQALQRIAHMRELHKTGEASRFELNLRLQELLLLILQQSAGASSKPSAAADSGIEHSIDYMHKHYAKKIKLDTLAAISGFTPTSYSREFKKMKGQSPIEYLTGYRIARAKELLRESRLSVRQVASSSGFGSEFYFSRLFKREAGISPVLYMKSNEVRIAVASCFCFQDILQSFGITAVFAANCHQSRTMTEEEHSSKLEQRLREMREARPELIICDHYHRPFLERFKQIAPAVALNVTMDWRDIHLRMAGLIGQEEQAARHFRQLDARLAESRKLLRQRYGDETVAIMRIVHSLIRIQGACRHPLNDLIYNELGLRPGYLVPVNQMNVEFSPDNYPAINSDHLFIQNHFTYPEDAALLGQLQQRPEWHAMKPVYTNHTRYIANWVAMSWSPAGRMRIIDELVNC